MTIVTGDVSNGDSLIKGAVTDSDQSPVNFKLNINEAETIFMSILSRREAILKQKNFDITIDDFLEASEISRNWVENSQKAYSWRTRTPLAIVLCGLLARATSNSVDPLSIQDSSGPYGYSASGLWREVIFKHGSSTISLRKLKDQPFNNSPFNGKRRLSKEWVNISKINIKPVSEAFDMLHEVSAMSPSEAESALLSFVVAAPDSKVIGSRAPLLIRRGGLTMPIGIVEFSETVTDFILLNSDEGRRAQAFVVACIEVALPGQVYTSPSVNDPSFRCPGDVNSYLEGDTSVPGSLFIEVKDKIVRSPAVLQFLKIVKEFDPEATAGYAAFANNEKAENSLDTNSRIPSPEFLTRSTGVPILIWKSPLELLIQVCAWSGLNYSRAALLCAHNYRKWLEHLDTGKNNSPEEWDKRMISWKLIER